MTLPTKLSTIFRIKQKSYKMVLIISIIDEYKRLGNRQLPLDNLASRFLQYYKQAAVAGKTVDIPPKAIASRWLDFTITQTKSLLKTPIAALSSILDSSPSSITFKPEIWDMLDDQTLKELENYAWSELNTYNQQLADNTSSTFSLHDALNQILNQYPQAKTESFANHSLGTLVRQSIPEYFRSLSFIDENYKVQGSIGQGNWATIPWIAILDKRNTTTTQNGQYIVYLFAEDMQSVYLTFNQGVTAPIEERGRREGHQYLEEKAQEIREQLPLKGLQKDSEIRLTSSGLGRDYQVSTVAYIRYDRDNIPDDDQLLQDLKNVMDNYKLYMNDLDGQDVVQVADEVEPMSTLSISEQIDKIKAYINHKGFYFPENLIENFYLSLKTKPFVILAGVSGTGKTKLVKLFAEAIGATSDNQQFTLIPVRPDWSDPSDLLGYKDLSGKFRPGKLTEVLIEASKPSNRHKPYFICLDEMNLARVEHYFSDLLSVIETQEWKQGRIVTAPLFHPNSLHDDDRDALGKLHFPDNVYLIGTVNMDETTHPFSKKVLDRANTIEFNFIDLEQYPQQNGDLVNAESYSASNSFLRSEYLQLVDMFEQETELSKRTTEQLIKVNKILEQIHSHVGFRVRDAVCFYMAYSKQYDLLSEEDAFDLQLLQKILPRVQGSSYSVKRVLLQLMQEALGRRITIDNYLDDASEIYNKWVANQTTDEAKYPRSAKKIAFMLRRIEEDGFTSYWLS